MALEDAGADYVDVARRSTGKMMSLMNARSPTPPFALPFLKAGKLVIGQTANILLYLGSRHDLAPKGEAGKLWVHQLQLTVADFVVEVHDTHHPLGPTLYYEDQRPAAKRRSDEFWSERVSKFLGYFEQLIVQNKGALPQRPQNLLRGPFGLSMGRRAALCVSEPHEAFRTRGALRP